MAGHRVCCGGGRDLWMFRRIRRMIRIFSCVERWGGGGAAAWEGQIVKDGPILKVGNWTLTQLKLFEIENENEI